MLLLYLLFGCCLLWSIAHGYLFLDGNYPTQLIPLQLFIFSGGTWVAIDSIMHWEAYPSVYVGFGLIFLSSIAWVPLTISAVRQNRRTCCWTLVMFLQTSGFLVLAVTFCILEAIASACICGVCTVLMAVYAYRMYYIVETEEEGYITI